MENLEIYFDDMQACPCKEVFEKIEYPWQALKKKDEIIDFSQNKIEGKIAKTAEITGNVKIGKGTKIGENVVIEGPCIIGENCLIRPGVMIRPKSIIGNDVVLGHGVEIKNSILFNECKVSTTSFVGDSILGKGARIASGVITGNRRFDQKSIIIEIDGKMFSTKMEKFGCILGDYVRIGANCSTAPGTLIGKHTWTYANMAIRGLIPAEKILKLRQNFEIVDKDPIILKKEDSEGEV